MTEHSHRQRALNPALRGMEIFEIQPAILGGSPTDPDNKAFLSREEHIQLVRYWNKVIRDIRQSQQSG